MPQSKKGRQKVTIFGKTQYFVGLSLLLFYGGGHLKKKHDFIRDVNHFMMNNRLAYDRHFNKNSKTSSNPYYKIDALVWRYH